jgi:hypothetical protein
VDGRLLPAQSHNNHPSRTLEDLEAGGLLPVQHRNSQRSRTMVDLAGLEEARIPLTIPGDGLTTERGEECVYDQAERCLN